MTKLRFEPEAKAEIREAVHWYGEREAGIGRQLLDEVGTAVAAIEALPRRFAKVDLGDDAVEVRRCLLKRFPYAIV